jgi:hypothetical protein
MGYTVIKPTYWIPAPLGLRLFGEEGVSQLTICFELKDGEDPTRELTREEQRELDRVKGLFPEAEVSFGLMSYGISQDSIRE